MLKIANTTYVILGIANFNGSVNEESHLCH